MIGSWRTTSWGPLRRRLWAGVTLVAYLLAALGVPLPASTRKETDLPFPCQDHPCGCQTAEQCWSASCCFTPEERWAWAAAHDVTPPAYAERPAGGWRQTPLREQDSGEGPRGNRRCCQGKHEGAGERR